MRFLPDLSSVATNFFISIWCLCSLTTSLLAQTVNQSANQTASQTWTLTDDQRQTAVAHMKELMTQQEFYVQTTPHEKVFLHLDKPYYTKGDTIWYKAYALFANGMTPDTLNWTLYVDFVQQDGTILSSTPLFMQKGMADGYVAFRDSLMPGYYMIRAYTNWMRNFTDEPLYSTLVPIYGKTGTTDQTHWLMSRNMVTGAGEIDTLRLNLQLTNAIFQPLAHKQFKFDFRSRDIEAAQNILETDDAGKAVIQVSVPKTVRKSVGDLRLVVDMGEKEEKTDLSVSLMRNDSIHIQFLPEGGQLVNGVCSRVAYKAVDQSGMSVKVEGDLFASNRDPVLFHFISSDLGMGAFYLTPQAGVTYYAVVKPIRSDVDEIIRIKTDLPEALPRGYVMEVSNIGRGDVLVFIKRKGIASQDVVGLTVRSGGRMSTGKVLAMQQDSMMISFSRSLLEGGVSEITLFDQSGQPLCERMIFVNKYQPLSIQAAFNKTQYGPREKVDLEIKVADSQGRPVQTALSLSVTDATQVLDTSRMAKSLLTHMLLSSDLRGRVENPGYYFIDTTITRKKALDLLMMTQGWRRYDLSQALQTQPQTYPWKLEWALKIRGQVQNMTTGKGIPDVQVLRSMGTFTKNSIRESRWLNEIKGWEYKLAMQQQKPQDTLQTETRDGWQLREFQEAVTDSDGNFLFHSNLRGEYVMMFMTHKLVGKKKKEIFTDRTIQMLDSYEQLPAQPFMRHLDLHPEDMKAFYEQQRSQNEVHAVIAEEERQMKILRDSITTYVLPAVEVTAPREAATMVAQSLASYQFDAQMASLMMANTDNSVEVPGVFDILLYMYPTKVNLSVTGEYTWEGRPIVTFDLTPTNILPDNHDYRTIETIYVAEDQNSRQETYDRLKQYPEYWESLFDLNQTTGEGVFNAVVVFYSRKQTSMPQAGIRRMWWKGYLKPVEFYSPDYENYDKNDVYAIAESEYDQRSTLYWNPNVETDAEGKAAVSFYNSDRSTQLHVNVQGMTSEGLMGAFRSE